MTSSKFAGFSRDARQYLEFLDDLDLFDIAIGAGGHAFIRARGQGELIDTVASTSGDRRGLRNSVARLKRAGYDLDELRDRKRSKAMARRAGRENDVTTTTDDEILATLTATPEPEPEAPTQPEAEPAPQVVSGPEPEPVITSPRESPVITASRERKQRNKAAARDYLYRARRPVTAPELADAIGVHKTSIYGLLRELDVLHRNHRFQESDKKPFRVYALDPVSLAKEPAPLSESFERERAELATRRRESVIPESESVKTEREAPTQPEPETPAGEMLTFAPNERPPRRIFEETDYRYPGGGIILVDDQGNLHVARPLVEMRE